MLVWFIMGFKLFMVIEEYINDVNIKKCMYGLGKRNIPAKTILEKLNISIDFVCDKNEDVLGNYNNRYKKMTLNELIGYPKRMIVFITIGGKVAKQAKEYLVRNDNLIILLFDEFIKTDYAINGLFGKISVSFNKKSNLTTANRDCHGRIAVFTCITGGYDEPVPIEIIEDNIDYFFFTDDTCIDTLDNYNIINISSVVPDTIKGPKEQNRYIKMHGYSLFRDYAYSIYIDGNLKIEKPIRGIVSYVGKYGLAMHKLTSFNITDPYEEAMVLIMNDRVSLESAINSLSELARNGLPRNCGVLYGNVIVCENNNEDAQRILGEWFKLYQIGVAKRDQFYLPFVLWEKGIDIDQIGTLPGMAHTNGYFRIMSDHTGYQYI